ncbi:MAG TPA: NADH-quinone oxidoreductase subunit N, partial [Kofleriaceae bacterium]|nr:NADH-quinone oxidoreductase subunit N [Kofleriaceae bacterium]
YLILAIAGMLVVMAEAFFKGSDRSALSGLTVVGALASTVSSIILVRQLGADERHVLLGGMLVADRMSYVLAAVFAATTAATALISPAHQREHGWQNGEYYGVMLLSASGMVMLAHASDLCTVFLGVETMSIGVYVMTGLRRRSKRGNEAALKYFLMGAFATGFLLYGMALLFGAAGTSNLLRMQSALASTSNPGLVVAGGFLLVIAFGFKVAAVPFHMWAPDAYEGAPSPVTAFMAAAVKAGAVAAMLRLFGTALGGDVLPFGTLGWASPLVVIAALTITFGNIAAVRQENLKRMLAYSSISHGGVLLVGLAALGLGSATADSAIVFYLIAYCVTTIGAFSVIIYVGSAKRERLLVEDWAGLAGRHPAAALAMTVCLLSLGGMPPTGGFFAKFYLFKAATEVYDGQLLWLVVIGVVNSAVSIYYYLRIVTAMYFREANEPFSPTRSTALVLVMGLCAALVLELGLMPGFWLRLVG